MTINVYIMLILGILELINLLVAHEAFLLSHSARSDIGIDRSINIHRGIVTGIAGAHLYPCLFSFGHEMAEVADRRMDLEVFLPASHIRSNVRMTRGTSEIDSSNSLADHHFMIELDILLINDIAVKFLFDVASFP
jgi:hypothetical protein